MPIPPVPRNEAALPDKWHWSGAVTLFGSWINVMKIDVLQSISKTVNTPCTLSLESIFQILYPEDDRLK